MNNKRTYKVGTFLVELVIPDHTKDLNDSIYNNIELYDLNGKLLWNINRLLKAYSDENGLEYYDELYFDIKPIDNNKIFCVGFINHCEIDLINGKILRLVNNR